MMLDQMEYQPKLNENYMCFLHYISSFESMYFLPPVLLSHFVFTPLIVGGNQSNDFHSRLVDWFLCGGDTGAINEIIRECHSSQLSRNSFSIAKKKKKNHLNRFSRIPYPHNGQGLLIKTRVFCCGPLLQLDICSNKKDCHSLILK